MFNNPKVSVVAPMYNVEPYLRECIDSVVNQTLQDVELILVDDGSPDNSGCIADEYAAKDSRIRVIHKQNGGVSAARNDGIAAATGQYIFLLDSDDYLELDALEKLYKTAMDYNADIVLSDYIAFSANSATTYQVASKEFFSTSRVMLDAVQLAVFNMGPADISCGDAHILRGLGAAWHYLIRLDVLKDNQISFDSSLKGLFDDGCFSLNVLEHAQSIAYISYPTYYYRHVEASITRKFGAAPFAKYEVVYNAIQRFINENNKGEEFEKALCLRKLIYINKSMSTYFFHPQNQASETERYKEFVKLVESPVYAEAFPKIDAAKLGSMKTRTLLTLLKIKCYRGYWVAKKYSNH